MIRLTNEALSKSMPFKHDILHRVVPDCYQWSAKYGKTFLCWFGVTPRLVLVDPDMIREALLKTNDIIDRDSFNPVSRPLIGDGLPGLMGHKWSAHRKIAIPAFTMEKVKAWVPEMVASVTKVLNKLEEIIGEKEEIEMDVHKEFYNLTAEVQSKAAFGSNFEKGKHIFELQQPQKFLYSQALHSVYIPGFRYLPTKLNKLRWKLDKETRDSVRMIIETCRNTNKNSTDFLSVLLSRLSEGFDMDDVIDECKTLFFGWEATANTLTWAILLLAQNQEWQEKAREEVLQVCKGNEHLLAENLQELKIVDMIIKETVRLYTPDNFLTRKTLKNTKLGSLNIPAKTELYIPQTVVHHDTEIWGPDAHEFNPARFVDPPMHLAAFFPFGLGARMCVGRHYALAEVKISLAMLIKKFCFTVSPSYVHAPMMFVMVQPQYGAHVLVRRITT
ncbi:Cytochrome P450, family 721, subfamily A, polypeptide 1 [Heracleum sosnowskyi]|uniref:Cytochrome P450, family 721, subfamily A, polypeptide 1 n=1 Tax=Heracleum sosnowskyi TaxID=360622 RepID=A0AAD8H5R9_9APIA|nr:Cytochrome P450, family 721, subfamily A, polypeptide 1 [Heracleum sosnowskyi]